MLQRKSSWTDADVSRFTSLVRQDHLIEQEEARAKAAAELTESEVEREFTELMRAILYRYHEEQIWSDKIRSVSTYGSLTVLGLNLLVFVAAILFVEPWKRRKLAQTFEKKVEEMTTVTNASFEERSNMLSTRMDKQDELLIDMARNLASYVTPMISLPDVVYEDIVVPAATTTSIEEPPKDWSSMSLPEVLSSTLHGLDLRWLVVGTSLTATAVGWLARGWYGR